MEKVQFKIGGMSCYFCAETSRQALTRMEGVSEVHVSLAHEETLIEYDPAKVVPDALEETLVAVGYTVRDPAKVRSFEEEEEEIRRERDRLIIAGSLTWVTFLLMLLMWLNRMFPYTVSLSLVLAFITVFVVGWPILKMAWGSLRRRIFNQHVLLEFAAFAGLIGGLLGLYLPEFPSPDFFGVAVFVTAYHILSQYVSLHVRTRSSQAVRKLLSLQSATAWVIRDGREGEVPIEEVRAGDLVRVKPGGQIPVDGEVVDGNSAVNESLVTGEPLPKEKGKGDQVIGGSVNQEGSLIVRVTRVGQESFLQQVAKYIQEARALKPSIIQLVDRILKYFVPGVLAFAGAAILIWTLGAWIITGQPDFIRATFAALAVLVMGYPCALGMATPLAMIRGGGEAAQRGILMRTGEAFQVFKDVKKVILDKTGTITLGKPQVADLISLTNRDPQDLLRLAASAEQPSEHPVAQAIVNYSEEKGLKLQEASGFQAVPGLGIRAEVAGKRVLVGNLRFLQEEGVDVSMAREEASKLEAAAKTVMGVADQEELIGLLTIADVVKEDAAEAIRGMERAGLMPAMLTGDNEHTARAIASLVGIKEVHAQVLPQDKAARVRELQQRGFRVAMVGDGINDAPALMQADIGIAIGAGTDIAIESSDVILVRGELIGVNDSFDLSINTYRKIRQNLLWAFFFNGVGIPVAATGILHPLMAMAAMVLSTSAIMINSFGSGFIPRREIKGREKIFMSVPGIHCQGCVDRIRDHLIGQEGIRKVDGDPVRKTITVAFERRKVRQDEIREAIAGLGYTPAD